MKRLAHIIRHPIKAHGREELASVVLSAGACLPWDRIWAVAHDAARLEPGWNSCVNFSRGAKAPQLMAITAELRGNNTVALNHPNAGPLVFRPDDPDDLPRFLDWVRPIVPANRAQPARILRHDGGMTDNPLPVISILSTASNAELGRQMGMDLSIHRWRGNLWLDGLAPFAELQMVGQRLKIGGALVQITERITRCSATTANPDTGLVDGNTLAALDAAVGAQDFGVFARVVEGGTINRGDEWSLQ